MDIGDIFSLIFIAFLLISMFGGLFARDRGGEDERRGAPGPRDIAQSGGQDRPRPQRPPQERQMPTTATEWWEELTGQRQAPERRAEQPTSRPNRQPQPVAAHDDAIEGDRGARLEARLEDARQRYGTEDEQSELLERDITMDVDPERRPRQQPVAQRRGRRSDATFLRGWLKDPDTLGRAFIVKEVIDAPLSLRDER